MIYVCFISSIGVLGFIRLVSLLRRVKWRDDLDDFFPVACGDWSVPNGCTRVTLEQSGCERAKDITTENSLIFNVGGVDRLLNTQIEQCVEDVDGAKLMSPSDLSSNDEHGYLIHVSFNSGVFGFIDDMYMQTEIFVPEGHSSKNWRSLSIQSQLRTGKSDLGINYDRVKSMLDCLNDTFMNSSQAPLPCSQ